MFSIFLDVIYFFLPPFASKGVFEGFKLIFFFCGGKTCLRDYAFDNVAVFHNKFVLECQQYFYIIDGG